MTEYRAGLPPIPRRMMSLPVDARGYPVPYFVSWVNGVPEFRVMDGRKLKRCVEFDACWVCGDYLGRHKAFVIGPMCAVNRVSAEPPSHRECAEFSAEACPFLTLPKAKRREANLPEQAQKPAGHMIERNPGVTLVWITKSYEIVQPPGGGFLFKIGEPSDLLWYSHGRTATRQEVLDSIETGLPLLREAAELDDERDRAAGRRRNELAVEALARQLQIAMKLVPAA